MVVDGEAFLHIDPPVNGLRLRLLPAEMVDEADTRDLPNGSYVVTGIAFNPAGKIVATLCISDPAALAAIERGDVTGGSIGYRVAKWQDSFDTTGQRVRTTTTWELDECSLVAIPADSHALIRSATLPELSPTVPDAATL